MKRVFRVNDWWQGKAALLMGMVYLFVYWFNISFPHFVKLALASIITISGFASLGYLLNDWFDLEKDRLAGKHNSLEGKTAIVVLVLFVIAIAALLLPWFYLPFNTVSVGLIFAEVLTFVLYSVPPIRLKERGLAGVFADALYAHSLPVMLAAYTFMLTSGANADPLLLVLLLVMQTISGIRNIVIHQYQDAAADHLAGSVSFFSRLTDTQFKYTILICISAEITSLSFFLGLLAKENYLLLLCQPVIWLSAFTMALLFVSEGMNAFLASRWRFFPNNLIALWIPVTLLLVLTSVDTRYVVVAVIHLLLFNYKFYVEVYNRGLVPLRDSSKEGVVKLFVNTRYVLSFMINIVVYGGFLLFGVDLKKEKVSALEYLRKQRRKENKANG